MLPDDPEPDLPPITAFAAPGPNIRPVTATVVVLICACIDLLYKRNMLQSSFTVVTNQIYFKNPTSIDIGAKLKSMITYHFVYSYFVS